MQYVFIFLPALVGGLVQSLTGFGSSIFTMLALPLMMSMLQATAISSFILLWLNLFMTIQFRKYVQPKVIALPVIAYVTCNYLGIQIAKATDMGKLKSLFGIFLILMALYFLFVAKRISIKGSPVSALVCGCLAGLSGGLFGIAGPPLAIYFLAVSGDDKNVYIGNMQATFVCGCIVSFIVRLTSGILTLDMLPMAIPGVLGVWFGKQIGVRILDRINIDMVRKLVYAFLIFSGVVTFLSSR